MKNLLTALAILISLNGCIGEEPRVEIVLNKYTVPPRIVRELGCLMRLDTSYHIVTRTTLQTAPFQDDAVSKETYSTLNIGDTIIVNSL